MINADDFVAIIPRDGLPFLAEPGADLTEYLDQNFFRISKTVVLKGGQSLTGSVFRSRETTAADEIHMTDLINQRFNR
jgi:hypothetical protein